MKKTLIVGNWKMNLDVQAASLLVHRLDKIVKPHRSLEVVLAPSLLALQPVSQEIDRRKFRLAAQNAYFQDEGAFTGEVSFTMLRELVHYVIVGHSERRLHFNEDLEIIRDKVQASIRNGIAPILCIGETQRERQAGETRRVIHDQLTTALANLTSEEIDTVVVAYEPVWAIGSGQPGQPDDIREVVVWIQQTINDLYGLQVADGLRILYGGSVAPEFVGGILAVPGVSGLLVGHDSLNYHQFATIIDNAYRARHQEVTA